MSASPEIDLSTLPDNQRDAIAALVKEVAELRETTQRQEHLIAELHHALYGKTSEKLSDDDRQLAFEDLEIALAEVEEQKAAQAPADDTPKRRKIPQRNRGNLPEGLPRIEQVIEPDSLEWLPLSRHWSERQWRRGCGLMHKIGVVLEARLWRRAGSTPLA